MLIKNMKNIFNLCVFLFLLISCGSEINVKVLSENRVGLAGPGAGANVNNRISLSSLSVSNIQTNSFDVQVNYIGDLNSNAITIMHMCNETRSPGCVPDLVGINQTMARGSSMKSTSIGPLLPSQYSMGERINIVVITTDVDGVNIGARLTTSFNLLGPTSIYRSMGHGNTTALATGAGNALTITNGRASFASALADRIGIGDALQFDNDNNGSIDAVVFISEREDAQNYQVRTFDGSLPTDLTGSDEDWSIFRAYTSISDIEDGIENTGLDDGIENFDTWSGGKDLVAATEEWHMVMYADAVADGIVARIEFDGWTTDSDYKIKFYTPTQATQVGTTQRHNGLWDEQYFTMKGSGSGLISLNENIDFEGIQLYNIADADIGNQMVLLIGADDSRILVKDNLVRGEANAGGNSLDANIRLSGTGTTNRRVFFINNIVIDGAVGLFQEGTNIASIYMYNNTFVGQDGISTRLECNNGSFCKLVNNLFFTEGSTAFQIVGTADFSANNLTPDTSSPDGAAFQNKIIPFSEPRIFDYRIAGHAYSAIGTGADLSADSDFAFTTDITGRSRSRWDIGASTAPKSVFRSVGPNTAVQVGTSNNMSIAVNSEGHTQVTFTNPVSEQVGVGDALEYDADNNASVDNLAFLSFRIDSRNFIVKDAMGDNAVVTSVGNQNWSIFRAYVTPAHAAAGNNENGNINIAVRDFDNKGSGWDYVANDQQFYMAIDATYNGYDQPDTIITSDLNFIKIFAPSKPYEIGVNKRHRGVWDNSKARWSCNCQFGFVTMGGNFRLEGLQLRNTATANERKMVRNWYSSNQGTIVVTDNLLFQDQNFTGEAFELTGKGTQTKFYIANNIVNGHYKGMDLRLLDDSWFYIANNTFNNTFIGIDYPGGDNASEIILENNIVSNSGSISFQNIGAISGLVSANNLSSDATSPDGAAFQNQTVRFKDPATLDFRLDSMDTSAAKDGGVEVTYMNIQNDLIGNPRLDEDKWDLGAHESATAIYRSVGPSNTSAIATGAGNNMTISSGIATFGSTMEILVGVGDAIQYDSNNSGTVDSIMFIHQRIDAGNFVVRTADGSIPADMATPDNDWAIYRAYTALADIAAGAGENTGIDAGLRDFDNLITARDLNFFGEEWHIALYADAPDPGPIAFTSGTWITGPSRGLRLFTPYTDSHAGSRQRHEGVWRDRFYHLAAAPGSVTLTVLLDYITIDGLQIPTNSSADSRGALQAIGLNSGSKITNNIIRSGNPANLVDTGIAINSNGYELPLVANNIIYGLTGLLSRAIFVSSAGSANLYNNTIVGNFDGIDCAGIICNCKNNISVNNTSIDYTGCDATLSDSNIASDTTAVGSNALNSQTVNFLGLTGDDYRLHPLDSTAKDAGADLTLDGYASVATDIVDHAKDNSPDIGAHEAATRIYRSIGESNTSSLQNGTGNDMTIASSIATFALAIANNIGVGDAIQYDRSGDGTIDDIMFIHERISSTQYRVATAGGATVPDLVVADQDWDIFRAYTAIGDVLAATGNENTGIDNTVEDFDSATIFDDLGVSNIELHAAVYADGVYGPAAHNLRSPVNNYVRLFAPREAKDVGITQAHRGVFDSNKVLLERVMGNNGLTLLDLGNANNSHFIIEGLQLRVDHNGFANGRALAFWSTVDHRNVNMTVLSNIITEVTQGNTGGLYMHGRARSGELIVVNNIFNNLSYGMNGSDFVDVHSYNNTFYNNDDGVRVGNRVRSTNNLVMTTNGGQTAFDSGFTTASSHNLSSDATAPGASSITNTSTTFLDTGNNNFRLDSTDTAGSNAGLDLSTDSVYAFNTDITGATRTQWDIGAHRYIDFANLTEFDAVGDGTISNPYQLFTVAQLLDIGDDVTNGCNSSTAAGCTSSFEIQNDINLSAQTYTPIGELTNRYSGTFDCQNNTISNLNLGTGAEDFLGLFGYVENANIRNCVLDNFTIDGDEYIAALAGTVFTSNVENIQANSVTITGRRDIGGVIGRVQNNPSILNNISSSGTVTGTQENVGGVLGRLSVVDTLTNISSTTNVTGADTVGGVFGWVDLVFGSFSNIYSTGDVTCTTTTSDSYCGGVLGLVSRTSVNNAYATGTVSGSRNNIGGLIGGGAGGIGFGVNDSYALGDVIGGVSSNNVGGLVGHVNGNMAIVRSFAAGDVKSGGSAVGGLAGLVERFIHDSYALGKVEITDAGTGNNVGGLVGQMIDNNNIERSWSAGEVINRSANASSNIGGLIGNFSGTGSIINSYSLGNVSGVGGNTGGFVGLFDTAGTIQDSHSSGNILSLTANTGGFVGSQTNGTIDRSYATGDVIGTTVVGGFAGRSESTITNSYNTGYVRGNSIGGFAGTLLNATLNNNYSLSRMSGTTVYSFANSITTSSLSRNYWNSDNSGANGSPAGFSVATEYEPFNDAQFRDRDNFDLATGGFWDFFTNWTQIDGRAYPIHKTSPEGQCADNITISSYTTLGNGDNDNPFIICNAEQWNDFAVNGCGTSGTADCDKYIILGADLDFRLGYVQANSTFSGVFDGRGKSINNMFYNGSATNQGLFDTVSGVVTNLYLTNGSITSTDDSVGLFAANITEGKILNVHGRGAVSANNFKGGIIANVNDINNYDINVVANSSFTGDVDGGSSSGGIIYGYSAGGSALTSLIKNKTYVDINSTGNRNGGIAGRSPGFTFSKNKSFGSITDGAGQSGGIVGNGIAGNTISKSYSHMDINAGGNDIGGLIGGSSSIMTNSYHAAGTIAGSTFDDIGGLIGDNVLTLEDSYANNNMTGTGSNIGGILGRTSASTSGILDNFWNESNGITDGRGTSVGPIVGRIDNLTDTTIDDSSVYTTAGWDATNTWLLANDIRAPLLRWDLHTACQENPTAITYNAIGGGSRDNPYLICFKEQLMDMSTNGCDSDSSAGCNNHYAILNDIDLKGETWLSIGDSTNRFTGSIDGMNHTISNLLTSGRGFIAYSGGGVRITNLKFALATISAFNSEAGILIGESTVSGYVENVHVQGSVAGNGFSVGGLVGQSYLEIRNSSANVEVTNFADEGTGGLVGRQYSSPIENSFAYGLVTHVSAGAKIGGLVGDLDNADIKNSWASVEINAPGRSGVGGLVGNTINTSNISYSYSYTSIVDADVNVGGLIGTHRSGTIADCFSVGSLSATGTFVGGFVGNKFAAAVINTSFSAMTGSGYDGAFGGNNPTTNMANNYWDSTLLTGTAQAGLYDGLATGDMDNSANFTGWDTTSTWRFPAGGYPEIVPAQ